MKAQPIDSEVLIFDIETDGVDIETAKLKWFGAHTYDKKTNVFLRYDKREEIQYILDTHRVLVGYNIKKFDLPILQNHGFVISKGKIILDLYEILQDRKKGGKGRGAIMQLTFPDMKLKNVIKVMGLEEGGTKGDIDYSIFKKDTWTKEELKEIFTYLKADIQITKNLFEHIYNYFYSFQEYLTPDQNYWYHWLNSSGGSYAYKVICNLAKIKETYGDFVKVNFGGGYVGPPLRPKTIGNIYCLDFRSDYPHNFMGGNLYSHSCNCCTMTEKWNGRGIFPNIKGYYCTKQMGRIEKTIQTLYKTRQEYKRNNDSRQESIKVIINSMYGISGNTIFTNLFNLNTASDCTYMGRESIKHARKIFKKEGFEVLYSDTDSVYIKTNDEKRMLKVRDQIIKDINNSIPFPQDTFGMGIDERIKAIFFLPDNPIDPTSKLKKKHYIYITQENEIVIKGLPIKKGNASQLSKHIYNNFLKQQILNKLDIRFNEGYIKDLIHWELKKQPNLAAGTYKVDPTENYKSKTSLQYQISDHYGPGTHYLIPNNRIGVGKGKKYCTLDEFKKKIKDVRFIDIRNTLKELEPFINPKEKQMTLLV